MQPSGLALFKRLHDKMSWLTSRQSLIAQNVANVDTPGYVARDLKALTFKQSLALAEPAGGVGRRPGFIPTGAQANGRLRTQDFAVGQEASISGNSVDLEHELKKSADTALDYQQMTHLYRKHLEMFRMAVRGDGG